MATFKSNFGMLHWCFYPPNDDDDQPPSWFDEDDEIDEFPSLIRKVRSMEFTSRPSNSSLKGAAAEGSSYCQTTFKFSRHHHSRIRQSSGSKASFLSALEFEETSTSADTDEESEVDDRTSMVARILTGRKLSIGCLSVILLACFTFSNFALDLVHARHDNNARFKVLGARRKLGLGTAAISTVTSALSPILPFTGGVDLRRQENWDTDKGWFHSMSSMVDQVRDAFGLEPLMLDSPQALFLSRIPRGGGGSGQRNEAAKMRLSAADGAAKRRKNEHTSTLGTPKPFVSVDSIAKLTLSDLTEFFQYAINNNRQDFQRAKFVSKTSERVKPILEMLDRAVGKSRGKDVEPAKTGPYGVADCKNSEYALSPSIGYGDVDALQFCAAMRLFAEWRVLRQVPEGYKGFAVGMNLGHKDIVQNVAKIEDAVHRWIDYRRELIGLQKAWQDSEGCTAENNLLGEEDFELRSPTLRDLLEHEVDMDVHPKRPRLKERTAAMGLLWVRRQLHYQTSLFSNIIKVPNDFKTANSAVQAAYNEVYGQYHGWAVQKIFNYSFQSAPEVEHIFKYMNPHRLKDAYDEARTFVSKALHLDESQETDGDEEAVEEGTGMSPLERFANHIGSEWDRFVDSLSRIFGKEDSDATMEDLVVRGGSGNDRGDEHDHYVRKVMAKDAHENILVYLENVEPLLNDLAGLFKDLNMDDPTKV